MLQDVYLPVMPSTEEDLSTFCFGHGLSSGGALDAAHLSNNQPDLGAPDLGYLPLDLLNTFDASSSWDTSVYSSGTGTMGTTSHLHSPSIGAVGAAQLVDKVAGPAVLSPSEPGPSSDQDALQLSLEESLEETAAGSSSPRAVTPPEAASNARKRRRSPSPPPDHVVWTAQTGLRQTRARLASSSHLLPRAGHSRSPSHSLAGDDDDVASPLVGAASRPPPRRPRESRQPMRAPKKRTYDSDDGDYTPSQPSKRQKREGPSRRAAVHSARPPAPPPIPPSTTKHAREEAADCDAGALAGPSSKKARVNSDGQTPKSKRPISLRSSASSRSANPQDIWPSVETPTMAQPAPEIHSTPQLESDNESEIESDTEPLTPSISESKHSHQCPACQKTFGRKNEMERHCGTKKGCKEDRRCIVLLKYLDEASRTCQRCAKVFSRSDAKLRHCRDVQNCGKKSQRSHKPS